VSRCRGRGGGKSWTTCNECTLGGRAETDPQIRARMTRYAVRRSWAQTTETGRLLDGWDSTKSPHAQRLVPVRATPLRAPLNDQAEWLTEPERGRRQSLPHETHQQALSCRPVAV
jgi:hypothetical protein